MIFGMWKFSETDSTKILSYTASSAGVCVARVACEDIRQEFGLPGVSKSGADVVTKLDNRLTGFQVTEYLFDLGTGKKGSKARGEESRRARAGLPAPMLVKPLSMSALIHLIRDKAKKGWSEKDFPDMRLLIAASVPQLGGTASTFFCLVGSRSSLQKGVRCNSGSQNWCTFRSVYIAMADRGCIDTAHVGAPVAMVFQRCCSDIVVRAVYEHA